MTMPSPTFAPGHDLVGRYRISRLLGAGHVAEVYLADDLSLRRQIVVKVLLSHLAGFEDVRRAFRDRIVRSATLSHPHLERVFDGGQESGHIFTITEYLEGGSLEVMLAAGRRLDLDDTARLGRDVAGALAYLNENGFVHGALSPNTLLFDAEGRVRVTDVSLSGLAGMHGEQLTYDEVRYLSPEQALGEPAGERSDVYALALILFEAATGSSPFEAMTPEAMLRTRVNTALPVRPELGALDMILAQAAVPDPRLRLSADQFANRLGGATADSAPLTLLPTRDDTPLLAQYSPSEPRRSVGFRSPSPDQIVAAPAGARHAAPPGGRHAIPTAQSRDTHQPSAGGGFGGLDDPRRARRGSSPPPRERRLVLGVVAILLIVAVIAAGAVWKLGLLTTKNPVPPLVGLTVAKAGQVLSADHFGFTLSVSGHARSTGVKVNHIISQTPANGTSAKSGQVIDVTVSDGPVIVSIPHSILGEGCTAATAQLLRLNVSAQCPASAAIVDASVGAGRVVRVLYHGRVNPASVPRGAAVTLVRSLGTGTTTTTAGTATPTTTTTIAAATEPMPHVVGDTYAQAYAAMKTAHLYFNTRGPNSGGNTWTTVTGSSPKAGTPVQKLSTVILYVK
jgi:eukaryotic-like serine/threonine-protein kinase